MYSRVVGEGGVSPDYFFNNMTFGEVLFFLKGFEIRKHDAWEQTRLLGYITAQVNSAKVLSPTDILSFSWDNEVKTKKDIGVSDNEIKRLREKAKRVERQLNKQQYE